MKAPVRTIVMLALVFSASLVAISSISGESEGAESNEIVTGIVTLDDNPTKGISGVIVSVNGIQNNTDSNGKFTISFIPRETNTISFTYTGYSVKTSPFGNGQNNSFVLDLSQFTKTGGMYNLTYDIPVVLEKSKIDLVGTVSSDGARYAVAGAKVVATGADGTFNTVTDQQGSFRFENILYGTYSIEVSCTGYGTETVVVGPDSGTISITMDATPIYFSGYIRDVGHQPLDGVKVSINGSESLSDEDGAFNVSFTRSEEDTITLYLEGYSIVSTPFGNGSDNTYTLTLNDFTEVPGEGFVIPANNPIILNRILMDVSGTVVSGTPVYPLDGAKIVATGTDGVFTVTADDTGTFHFTSIPLGTYSLKASCVGYTEKDHVFNPMDGDVQIALDPAEITMTGFVCDSNGKALNGVQIHVNGINETVSGTDGMFTLSYLKNQTDIVTFVLNGYSIMSGGFSNVLVKTTGGYNVILNHATQTSDGYSVTVSDENNPLVMKQTLVDYHGHIMSKDGSKVYVLSGAEVILKDGNNSYSNITNETGYFSIQCPASGTYTAYVQRTGYVDLIAPVTSTAMDLQMQPDEVTITGITMEYNDAGVKVALRGASISVNNEDKGTVGADGTFSIKFYVKESNTISFHLAGYKVDIGGFSNVLEGSDGVYTINLSGASIDGLGRFVISDESHPIILNKTTVTFSGSVMGMVGGEMMMLNDAFISLISSTGKKLTTHTDSNGEYSIECGYDNYRMSVEYNGFLAYGPVDISPRDPVNNIVMEPYDSSLFFGLDFVHSMMIVGTFVLTLVLLFALAAYVTSKKGLVKTENDMQDDTEE